MASQPKIDANRNNALQSTGPRTAEGKAVSSTNAVKHGLTAAFRVLPNENQPEFDALVADYHRTFSPSNTHERFLVDEMAQSRWLLARIRRLESAVIDQMLAATGSDDPDAVLAAALLNNTAGPFKTLQRYAAAAERSYYRALRQMQALRKQEPQPRPAARPKVRNEPKSMPYRPLDYDPTYAELVPSELFGLNDPPE